jgi:hypothetical protein
MARTASAELPHFAAGPVTDQMKLRPLSGAPTGRETIERARSEALQEARAAFERTRAEDRAAFDQILADREREFNQTTAAIVLQRLDDAMVEVEQKLAAAAARILARFLSAKVRERALKELAETVAGLTAGKAGLAVTLFGPPSLIAALETLLADKKKAMTLSIAPDAPEVTATLDDTMIETRLGEWAARLENALDGAVGG